MYSRIVMATQNDGKTREFRDLLRVAGLTLVSAREAGIHAFPEETGETFAANARAKAVFVARVTEHPAIADDSGIIVDALDGAPGVRSARFGDAGWDDAARNRYLLELLRDVPPERRTARFVAAVALVTPGGIVRETAGVLEGRVALHLRGAGGFGYDPLFVPVGQHGEERTLGQMAADEKNAISHRARALAAMRPLLVALMANGWEDA